MSKSIGEKPKDDTLEEEIDMLRTTMRQAFQLVQEIDDPAEKLRGLNVIGTAATRVANLLKTQRHLRGDSDGEINRAIQEAIVDVVEKLGLK